MSHFQGQNHYSRREESGISKPVVCGTRGLQPGFQCFFFGISVISVNPALNPLVYGCLICLRRFGRFCDLRCLKLFVKSNPQPNHRFRNAQLGVLCRKRGDPQKGGYFGIPPVAVSDLRGLTLTCGFRCSLRSVPLGTPVFIVP